jgi:hypothetical protein
VRLAVHRQRAERLAVPPALVGEQPAWPKVAPVQAREQRSAPLRGHVVAARPEVVRRLRAVGLLRPVGQRAAEHLLGVSLVASQPAAVNVVMPQPAVVGLVRRMDALQARRSAACAPVALRPVAEQAALDVQAAPQALAAEQPGAEVERSAVQGHAQEERLPAAGLDALAVARSEPEERRVALAAAAPDAVRRQAVALGAVLRPARQDRAVVVHPAAGRAAAASVGHRGRLRPGAPEPGPQPAAPSAHAIRSLPFASLTARSSQAAGDEVCSCDLGSPKDVKLSDEQICVRPDCGAVQIGLGIYFDTRTPLRPGRSCGIQAEISKAW